MFNSNTEDMANVSSMFGNQNSTKGNLIAYSGSMFLIGAWIVCSNILVILATLRTPKLRKRTGVFVSHLAVADIMSGIFVPLFWLMGKVAMPETNAKYVCGFYLTMQMLPLCASIANLLLIAVDRYLAIVFPLKTRGYLTKTRCKQLAAIGWSYSCVIGFINIPWNQYVEGSPCSLFHMANGYFFYMIQIPFWISLIAMIIMYGSIVYTVQKHCKFIARHANMPTSPGIPPSPSNSQKIRFGSMDKNSQNQTEAPLMGKTGSLPKSNQVNSRSCTNTLERQDKKMANEVKLTKMVCLVLGVFCACWIPMVITYTLYLSGYKREKMYVIASACGIFAYLNSGMNFIVYVLRSKEYRTAIKDIVTCKPDLSVRAPDSFTHSTSV